MRRNKPWRFGCLMLLMAVGMAPAIQAQTLRYPQDLAPHADGRSGGDVRVRTSIDAKGAVSKIEVLESTRPERNAEVMTALRAWHFVPERKDGHASGWTREFGYDFVEDVPPKPQLPQYKPTSPWLPADSDDKDIGYVPLPNEIWSVYPNGLSWSGRDPEARLQVIVAAGGAIVAARAIEVARPELTDAALDAVLRGCDCFSWPDGGKPSATVVDVPVRFYTSAFQTKKMVPPKYPSEMLQAGVDGKVRVVFTVAADGSVNDLQIFGASHPAYERAVMDAFLKTRFSPALRFGKPAASREEVRYTFSMENFPGEQPYSISQGRAASAKLPEEFRYDKPPEVALAINPIYPYDLAVADVGGSARVLVIVNPRGGVQKVTVLDADQPAFGEALKASMAGWLFKPATRNGEPTWAMFANEWRFTTSIFGQNKLGASAHQIIKEIREGSIVSAAQLDARLVPLVQTQPAYPIEEQEVGSTDDVTVEFFVDREGFVQLPHPVKFQNEALAWAAATGVSRWRFNPPMQSGKAVDARARTTVHFAVPPKDAVAKEGPAGDAARGN